MESLFQETIEGMSDAYISVDFDWNVLHLNSRVAAWSTSSIDEIRGHCMWEIFPRLVESPLHDFYQRCMKTRREDGMEYFSATTNRWYYARSRPTSRGMSIFVSDITDNKKIAEGQDQFLMMANVIPQLAWMADQAGNIHWYNDRWYEYTGTTMEEMAGWGWQKVHHPQHVDRVVAFSTEAWQQDKPWELTFPLRRHDGEYRWFLTRIFPVRNSEGIVEQWIGTNTDIHDQQTNAGLLEQKVAERTNELQEANQHLRSLNDELQQFNYVASHDLQEPLRKIKIFTERISTQDAGTLSPTSQHFLNRVTVSVDRMSDLLRDLLDFSSMNRDELFGRVDLDEILTNVQTDLELLIAQKSVVIHRTPLPVLHAIPLQMHQLIYNLINNAIKFTAPDRAPTVRIASRTATDEEIDAWQLPQNYGYLYLTVADNGIGFEPEYVEKIFELFKRLHSQQAYRGTGVGLALCKKVVENHEGKIWAESTLGEGATFHVVLPVD